MKKKSFSALLSFLLILVVATASAWARQVVTEEVRSWAKEALEQEKALETISAPNTVAVLYFYNKTEWSNLDPLQKGLTLMLMTDLSKVEGIQIVERVKLQALVEELDLGVSGLVESETASRVGRLLGAEHLVGGDIITSKIDQFKLKSSLLKVSTEEVFGEPIVEGELLAELFRMEKELLFEIVEELKIKLSPEQEAELRKPLTDNLKALLYFFQGIEQSDLGNHVCLRGEADLSTMDFTTKFTDSYTGDLRDLPWNDWLDTRDEYGLRYVVSPSGAPQLDNMYVRFTNPADESLKEQRWFNPRAVDGQWEGNLQEINEERLTINDSSEHLFTAYDSPSEGYYTVDPKDSGGFSYVVPSEGVERNINVAFFVVGDIDSYSGSYEGSINDIWDALRVNEGEGAPNIGSNNLEIVAIDDEKDFFTQPIDVVYVPMSRMLWKNSY